MKNVVDLFSGAGGMSYGFKAHGSFKLIGAADAEIGKPTSGNGRLQCNITYRNNIGIEPKKLNLAEVQPSQLRSLLGIADADVDVLSVCPPCTGFSRTNPQNHLRDDGRNSLVSKAADFAIALDADVVVMENARELIRGNFIHHYRSFRQTLEEHGYNVFGRSYLLNRFGLPQVRERSIIIAAKERYPLYTLESMWDGWSVGAEAKTVRRALSIASKSRSGDHRAPGFATEDVRKRLAAIPHDGGSWMDLIGRADADVLLTDSMKRILASGKLGSYPDVYGRMAWDKPAPTIKRESAHIGNGRYAHPEHDRLCSVVEMALLNGFPQHYDFHGVSLANVYRHIGDAVPPMISYQLAHLCRWILTNEQPGMQELILGGTSLLPSDLVREAA
ncbi:Cytosine-specific methyltransferase [Neorhizobium galegae bv. officinalis]|uniref:DNA (cytosine-5-)-methyltransferase n=1 Tax=Neorhizobium galegae bv. officinalis TaxID=323656 RepID=A0A0T7FKV0_NEOGA|nr:DNA cytosine methyltransferase [Neorhizobium galegae]CDZ35640.1 Cytosine-specific methyltransferase [Neorhizobium galegae bv. officinalis]